MACVWIKSFLSCFYRLELNQLVEAQEYVPFSLIIKLDASSWFRCLSSRSHQVFRIGIDLTCDECGGRVVPQMFHFHLKLGLPKHPYAWNSIFLVAICQQMWHLYLMGKIKLSHFHIFEAERARLISFGQYNAHSSLKYKCQCESSSGN